MPTAMMMEHEVLVIGYGKLGETFGYALRDESSQAEAGEGRAG
jgi:ketol-acid reductoisomerase